MGITSSIDTEEPKCVSAALERRSHWGFSDEGGKYSAVMTLVLENRDIDHDGENKAV